MSYRNQQQKAQLILERGRRLGLNTSCRVLSLANKVLDIDSNRDPGEPGYHELIEALYELPAWAYIFDHIEDTEFQGECSEMLSIATKDSLLLRNSNESKGRNAQLELLTYATLKDANLSPLRNSSGPDFTCDISGQKFAVEVKRVTSENRDKINDAISTARTQIKNAKLPGAIVLDFSASTNPHNDPHNQFLHPDEYNKITDKLAQDAMQNFILPKSNQLVNESVFNVILRCYHQIPSGKNDREFFPWTVLVRWHTHITVPNGGYAFKISKRFEKAFLSKLPG